MRTALMGLPRMHADRATRLRVYLNDHLAGAIAGSSLARRCLNNNAGTAMADELRLLHEEIVEDKATLRQTLDLLGIPAALPKQAAARAAELAGRLKLNGQLGREYTPLARLAELEALCAGVEAKRNLWGSLLEIRDQMPVLEQVDLPGLLERASSQRERLEGLRTASGVEAFGV